MTQPAEPFDASDMPDVARLVHDVNRSGRPRLLQVGSESARLSPARRPRRREMTPAEREEILRATLGGWKGIIDGEQLKRELNELQQDDATARTF